MALYLLFGNFGVAIIVLTVLVRLLLLPITRKSMESARQMQKLQPKLQKLKEEHGDDKQGFAQAQLALYKKHNVSPVSGCLPQIVQLVVLIGLFQAFNQVLQVQGEITILENLKPLLYSPLKNLVSGPINLNFLYLKLTEPDLITLPFEINLGLFTLKQIPGIFLVGAAVSQFFYSQSMFKSQKKLMTQAKETPGQQDDMAAAMQGQMAYMMPLITLVIGFRFPSGLVLYWLTFSSLMLVTNWWTQRKKKGELWMTPTLKN